jgi:hypothetical protein
MTRTAPVQIEAVKTIRLILLITVVSGMIGLEAELLLLGHIKPLLQLVPVLLIAFGLGAIAWYRISPGSQSMKLFQGTMALCIASGLIGVIVHLAFSASEATKKDHTLHGLTLLRVALTGAAPPFAPAAMIQIGLVGLAYTFRHPALDEEEPN